MPAEEIPMISIKHLKMYTILCWKTSNAEAFSGVFLIQKICLLYAVPSVW